MESLDRVKRTYWIPASLEQWLRERARRNYRSVTAELVELLREAKNEEYLAERRKEKGGKGQ